MSYAVWPVGVNVDVVRTGFRWRPQSNVDEAGTDSGPPIGQLKSNIETEIVGPFLQFFTIAEFATITSWRRDTLAHGTLPFMRVHPLLYPSDPTAYTFVFDPESGFEVVDVLPAERKVQMLLYRIA